MTSWVHRFFAHTSFFNYWVIFSAHLGICLPLSLFLTSVILPFSCDRRAQNEEQKFYFKLPAFLQHNFSFCKILTNLSTSVWFSLFGWALSRFISWFFYTIATFLSISCKFFCPTQTSFFIRWSLTQSFYTHCKFQSSEKKSSCGRLLGFLFQRYLHHMWHICSWDRPGCYMRSSLQYPGLSRR